MTEAQQLPLSTGKKITRPRHSKAEMTVIYARIAELQNAGRSLDEIVVTFAREGIRMKSGDLIPVSILRKWSDNVRQGISPYGTEPKTAPTSKVTVIKTMDHRSILTVLKDESLTDSKKVKVLLAYLE